MKQGSEDILQVPCSEFQPSDLSDQRDDESLGAYMVQGLELELELAKSGVRLG